jgi:hypothetical protein
MSLGPCPERSLAPASQPQQHTKSARVGFLAREDDLGQIVDLWAQAKRSALVRRILRERYIYFIAHVNYSGVTIINVHSGQSNLHAVTTFAARKSYARSRRPLRHPVNTYGERGICQPRVSAREIISQTQKD